MNLRKVVCNAVLAAGAAVSLQAHPGHAPFSEGAKHFVSGPVHVGTAILFSLALCGLAQLFKAGGERVFIRAVAALVAVAAIVS